VSHAEVLINNMWVADPLRGEVGLIALVFDVAGWHNVRLVEMGGDGSDRGGDVLDDCSFSVLIF
jgi:hypothetical protein